MEVWGSGNQSRVFVHAKDFAKGIQLVAEKYPKADPVNVGHDKQITIRELVEKIQVITGIYNDVFYNREKPGKGYPERAADTTKLRAVTVPLPTIPARARAPGDDRVVSVQPAAGRCARCGPIRGAAGRCPSRQRRSLASSFPHGLMNIR